VDNIRGVPVFGVVRADLVPGAVHVGQSLGQDIAVPELSEAQFIV